MNYRRRVPPAAASLVARAVRDSLPASGPAPRGLSAESARRAANEPLRRCRATPLPSFQCFAESSTMPVRRATAIDSTCPADRAIKHRFHRPGPQHRNPIYEVAEVAMTLFSLETAHG